MLRAAFFTALVAAAAATHYHGSLGGAVVIGSRPHCYGLDDILLPGQISSALGLLSARYPSINPLYAAQIIRHSIVNPPAIVLGRIGYRSVPALHLRLAYLRRLYGWLPSQTLYSTYYSPLTTYLGDLGISLPSSSLVNPLALLDYYAGVNQWAPISVPAFNQFFTAKLLNLDRPSYVNYQLPSLSYFVNRLGKLQWSSFSNYWAPLTGRSSSITISVNPVSSVLGGILLPGQINAAISLLSGRYPSISPLYAAQIIRQSIVSPPSVVLGRIGYSAVPALNLRLRYLRRLYGWLPSQTLYSRYYSPLSTYLGGMGISLPSASLVNPLAVVDYYAGVNQVAPVSIPAFNQFFTNQLLNLNQPSYTSYQLPSVSYLVNRLGSLRWSSLSSYWAPLTGTTSSVSVSYSGPGASLLPAYGSLGLPSPLNPSATLGGLHSYLGVNHIPFNRFRRYYRRAPIPKLVSSISYSSLHSRISSDYPFLSSSILRRDLGPLWAARYYAYPSRVRKSLYMRGSVANFNTLLGRYFRSSLFPSGSAYSTNFVSGALTGFDKYVNRILHQRYKSSYKHPLWQKSFFG